MLPEKSNTTEVAFIAFATVVAFSFFGAVHFLDWNFRTAGSTTTHLAASSLKSVVIGEKTYTFECPFAPQLGQIFSFENRVINQQQPEVEAKDMSPLATGAYIVSLYTYDGYAGRERDMQKYEQVFLDLYADDTFVTSVGPTKDLMDGTAVADDVFVVGTDVVIDYPVNKIIARSNTAASGVVDDVRVGCVRFEMISESARAEDDKYGRPTHLLSESNNQAITLSWMEPVSHSASAYHVYRDGIKIGTTDATSFEDANVTQGEEYIYSIAALDVLGNEFAMSKFLATTYGALAANSTQERTETVVELPEDEEFEYRSSPLKRVTEQEEVSEKESSEEISTLEENSPEEVDPVEPSEKSVEYTVVPRTVTDDELVVRDNLNLEEELVRLDLEALSVELVGAKREDAYTQAALLLGEKRQGRLIQNDSDQDGITDYDEVVLYGTDPFDAYTGGTSLSDGQLLLAGVNPVHPEEYIQHEDPRTTTMPVLTDFSVLGIRAGEQINNEQHTASLNLQGTAPRNSFVTVYIFSTPIVVTVRSDENGYWEYELTEELEDGNHEVHIATVNASGNIVAQSEAVPFVKEANAVTLGAKVSQNADIARSQGFFSNHFILITFLVACMGIAGAILAIGMHRNPEHETVNPDEGVSGS